jgi:hypothetical protein
VAILIPGLVEGLPAGTVGSAWNTLPATQRYTANAPIPFFSMAEDRILFRNTSEPVRLPV